MSERETALRILDRLAKWLALRSYRHRLGRLLYERYGRNRYYTPQQILTTIKLHGLSERFAPYACVMFGSKPAYTEFVKSRDPGGVTVDPVRDASTALWAGSLSQYWPEHHDIVTEIGHVGWDHPRSDVAHEAGASIHHGDDGGAGSHDGGGYDGGGQDGGDSGSP